MHVVKPIVRFSRLEVAEQAEIHYQLKRIDPMDTKATPSNVDSGVSKRTAKLIRTMDREEEKSWEENDTPRTEDDAPWKARPTFKGRGGRLDC